MIRFFRTQTGALRAFDDGRRVSLRQVWVRWDGEAKFCPHMLGPDVPEQPSWIDDLRSLVDRFR